MKAAIKILVMLCVSVLLKAQEGPGFRVYFKDKGSSIQLMDQPWSFLSPAAINRRALQGITLNESDLPLAPEYLKTLGELGCQYLAHSKWLNYVYLTHPQPDLIKSLAFVSKIEFPRAHQSVCTALGTQSDTLEYGYGRGQIEMLNGHLLHQRSYTGTGVNIAVIDAGFQGFLQSTFFDSLRVSNRLLGSFNFITGDTNVYSGWGDHGTGVLSTMAANVPDTFVGAAPHANYWLFTTENIYHERPIEMDHWVMAAEFADSAGAHLINSSLGYKTFDDAQFNLSYSDLDGNTSLITKGADLAASKGILVVASAGNTGQSADPYLLAPGDGDSVLTVGGLSWQGDFDPASSIGPTADGRIKPDVLAQSSPTTIVNGQGQVDIQFGTSFAAPVVAGLGACLIEAYPSRHSAEISDYIRRSAHLYLNPNDSMGYGIPNFDTAFTLSAPQYLAFESNYQLYPNPIRDYLIIDAREIRNWSLKLRIFDLNGTCLQEHWLQAQDAFRLQIELKAGLYLLQMEGDLNGWHRIQVY